MNDIRDSYATLAIAKAIEAVARDERMDADAEILQAYERDGTTQRAIRIGGVRVGTFSVAVGKDKSEITVTDPAAYDDWLLSSGHEVEMALDPEAIPADVVDKWRSDHPEWFCPTVGGRWEVKDRMRGLDDGTVVDPGTGEVVPGLEARVIPGRVTTRITGCKPVDVRAALERVGMPPATVGLMLPGGDA